MATLEVRGVTKIYKSHGRELCASKDVTLSVNEGEIVGFIGQNGAGKSTTLKIVTGLAEATSGTVLIDGYDVKKDRIQALKRVGCIVENPDLYGNWSAVKNLEYFADLNREALEEDGLSTKEAVAARIEELLKLVGLFDRRKDQVRRYSLGMKQRAGIAQALLCRPKLLILDEPTNGLDPAGIKELREILRRLAREYKLAVVVSSHMLAEVQQTCDRFIVIRKGSIVGTFSQEDLSGRSGNALELVTEDAEKAQAVLSEMGIEAERVAENKFAFRTEISVNDVAKKLMENGVELIGIAKKAISLEDFFIGITEEGGRQ